MKKTVSAHVYNTIEQYPQILKTPKVEKAMGNLKCWMALRVNRGFDNSSYVPYICIYLIKPYLMLLPCYWHGSTSKTCFVHLYTMLGQPIATHQRFRAVCIQLWRRLKREEESIMKLKDRPSPTPRPIFGDV